MPLLQRCSVCREKKPCVKRKCKDCTTPEDYASMAAKKNEKKKQWKKPVAKRKVTGELALFETIWNTRKRVSYISGKPITEFDVQCFAHVLSKGAAPGWRLLDRCIVLMTKEEHYRQHNVARSILEAEHPGWIKFFKLKEEFEAEYNRIFNQ